MKTYTFYLGMLKPRIRIKAPTIEEAERLLDKKVEKFGIFKMIYIINII